jgi:hypothetical protein
MQFYVSYRFYGLAVRTGFREWQVWVLSGLFLCIAAGNLGTTLWTVYVKWRDQARQKSE